MKKKKQDGKELLEEVKKDAEIKKKRMDPFLKARIKSLIFMVSFFLIVLAVIIIQPRNDYVVNDMRDDSYLTYSEFISNIHRAGFVFDEDNNQEGYILRDNGTTYLIKIFYKEDYNDADLTIYAYSNYYNRTGIVINRDKTKYKVHFYNNNEDIFANKDGSAETNSKNYLENKNYIINTVSKLVELNKKAFSKKEV